MPFVINHAPASLAMTLAGRAGRGDRIEREQRLASIRLQDQLAERDAYLRERAFEITNAMRDRDFAAEQERYGMDFGLKQQDLQYRQQADARDFEFQNKQFQHRQQNDLFDNETQRMNAEELAAYRRQQAETGARAVDVREYQGAERLGQGWARLDQQGQYNQGRLDQGQQRLDQRDAQMQQQRQEYVTREASTARQQQIAAIHAQARAISESLIANKTRGAFGDVILDETINKQLLGRLMELAEEARRISGQGGPQQGGQPAPAPAQFPSTIAPQREPPVGGKQYTEADIVRRGRDAATGAVVFQMRDGTLTDANFQPITATE